MHGDNAFGNDPVIRELEAVGQKYLFKLRQSPGVKRLIERLWSRNDWKTLGKREKRQQSLRFPDPLQPVKLWEYAVCVTNSDDDLAAIGQLYRDRADCETGFDELKNQWGWGGYTTQYL